MRRLCGTTTVTGLAIIEVTDPKAILEHCTAAGRTSEPERVARRLGHGLRFCSLLENGQIVANTWLIRSGARFLDEAMLKFELHSDASCLRDLYVRPESRGQRIFARFIGMLESGPLVGKRELWSCVDADNRASRAAHSHAGFELQATVSTVAVLDRLMWRRFKLPATLACPEYQAGRRFIWLDRRARQYRDSQLA